MEFWSNVGSFFDTLDIISSFCDCNVSIAEKLSLKDDDLIVLFLIDTINLGTFGGVITHSSTLAEFTMLRDVSDGNLGAGKAVTVVLLGIFNFKQTFLSSSEIIFSETELFSEFLFSKFIKSDGGVDG